MIIKKEKKGNVTVYYVDKDYDNNKLQNVLNKKLKRDQIKTIIDHDADVFDKEGKLLIRFRKNKLKQQNVDEFYDNVINFAMNKSNNRGNATGSKKRDIYTNPQVMSNILGYFDKLAPIHKRLFKDQGKPLPKITVRETRFLKDYPEKFKKLLPLIKEIDKYYEQLVPENYGKQRKKANQTPFRIQGTAFTTITTNVNFQTTVHTDRGDDTEGFGNLAVIEKGKYSGGETCIPQYGIGVDVRTGDILYMDVHEPHGNLPITLETPDAKRLSIVCYLRKSIWNQTKGKSKRFLLTHNKTIRNLQKKEKNNKIKD
jgi:hypothetical protein